MYPYIHIGKIAVSTFALVLLVALAVSMSALLLFKRSYLSLRRHLFTFFPIVMIVAGLSGRLLSAVILTVNADDSFWYNIINGGCVYYGAVAGGILSGYILCRKRKLDFVSALDVSMTALPLAQAIGRFGCFINGCCYGMEYTGIFAVKYLVDESMVSVFPTWFAESAACFVIWLIIYFVPIKRGGVITAIYCVGYGISRFVIEFFRGDAVRGIFGNLSTSQYISIPIVLIGAILFIQACLNKKDNLYVY